MRIVAPLVLVTCGFYVWELVFFVNISLQSIKSVLVELGVIGHRQMIVQGTDMLRLPHEVILWPLACECCFFRRFTYLLL